MSWFVHGIFVSTKIKTERSAGVRWQQEKKKKIWQTQFSQPLTVQNHHFQKQHSTSHFVFRQLLNVMPSIKLSFIRKTRRITCNSILSETRQICITRSAIKLSRCLLQVTMPYKKTLKDVQVDSHIPVQNALASKGSPMGDCGFTSLVFKIRMEWRKVE